MLPAPEVTQYVSMQFIQDLEIYKTEKPYYMLHGEAFGLPKGSETNLEFETRFGIPMHDIRGHESRLDLERDGFAYFKHDTKIGTRFDDEGLNADLKELVTWLQGKVCAERAICYDYRLRSNDDSITEDELTEDRTVPVLPVTIAHTDHTHTGGLDRAARHLTKSEKAKYLVPGKYRVRVFNIWKPLVDVVEDNPLAMCNPKSVSPDDLLTADRVSRTWVGEIYYAKFNPGQQWWWLSKQRKNEICTFVIFDSQQKSSDLNFCVHRSFINPSADPSFPPRRNIELRILAFNKL